MEKNIKNKIKRIELFLEDENFASAEEYCEKVLDESPENGKVYFYKLMIDLKINTEEKFESLDIPFENNPNFKKAIRFSNDNDKSKIQRYAKTATQNCKNKNEQLNNKLYLTACEYKNNNDYKNAIKTFKLIKNYKNSKQEIKGIEAIQKNKNKNKIRRVVLITIIISLCSILFFGILLHNSINLNIGDTITLGNYNKKDIHWKVIDRRFGKALIISEDLICHSTYTSNERDFRWESSSARSFLNNSFKNDSFSEDELNRILTSQVETRTNPDFDIKFEQNTEDSIFLLSIDEVYNYFPNENDRLAFNMNNDLIQSLLDNKNNMDGAKNWWLRTTEKGIYVDSNGKILSNVEHYIYRAGLRPAMWISLFK